MSTEKKQLITIERALLLGILVVQILLFTKYFAPHTPALQTATPQEREKDDSVTPPSVSSHSQMQRPAPFQPVNPNTQNQLPAPSDDANNGLSQNDIALSPFELLANDPFFPITNDFDNIFFDDPFQQFHEMNRHMSQMMKQAAHEFEQIENIMHFDQGWNTLNFSPTMDMRDAGDNYILTFSLPGVDPSNIIVTIDNRILTVRTEYSEDNEYTKSYRMFEKRVQLPGPIDADKVEKNTTDKGLLKITIPKRHNRENKTKKAT